MTAKKTATLNLCIDPTLKEAIREASQLDHRSVSNMIEVLILKYREQAGITIPEQQALFEEEANE